MLLRMNRRTLLTQSIGGSFGVLAALPLADLIPPKDNKIVVAVVIGPGATVIDFAGPWEVFQDVALGGTHGDAHHTMPFRLYTVSDSTKPIKASGGLRLIPDYDFNNAPQPNVIVMGAQGGHTSEKIEWIKRTAKRADVTASVCTGAFLLAKTGLLDGKSATTHHDFYDSFAKEFPKVKLERGLRFVDNGNTMTAGGLTSGINLAIRIVERYYGAEAARYVTEYMEFKA